MTIKGIIVDVGGTLLLESSSGRSKQVHDTPADGIVDMLRDLQSIGLPIVAASNNPVTAQLRSSGLAKYIDHVATKADVGANKGSPAWVETFERLLGVSPYEMFAIGDSKYDMITATRGPMIYAHASWSPSVYRDYGLEAQSPRWVANVIRHIFSKEHAWYWTLSRPDVQGRPYQAMTLLDANGAGKPVVKQALLQLLKDDRDRSIRGTPLKLSDFVMLHMLASVYDANLFGGADLWTTYPGHTGTPNAVMGSFLDVAAKLSRHKHTPDLLIRHTHSVKSADARKNHGVVEALRNQLETVNVNPDYHAKLVGKRVLLLDNFLTRGYSTEAARNLLLNAGAQEVIVACVGKYGTSTTIITPPSVSWDSFVTTRPPAHDFRQATATGEISGDALSEFITSLKGIQDSRW